MSVCLSSFAGVSSLHRANEWKLLRPASTNWIKVSSFFFFFRCSSSRDTSASSLFDHPNLEHAHKYETQSLRRIWDDGRHVIFDVDVKGGLQLKEYFGDQALAIFVKVPSLDVLEERLRDRKTDSEDSLSQRLFKAKFEMGFEDKFDLTIVNNSLEESKHRVEELVENFLNS